MYRPSGKDCESGLMLIGGAPTAEDVSIGVPFMGSRGSLLFSLLREVGLNRGRVYCTTVLNLPGEPEFPDIKANAKNINFSYVLNGKLVTDAFKKDLQLLADRIKEYKPKVVVPIGSFALWAVSGLFELNLLSIHNFRGNTIPVTFGGHTFWMVPTLDMTYLTRVAEDRWLFLHDIKKALFLLSQQPVKQELPWKLITSPEALQVLLIKNRGKELAVDIETRGNHIDCIGFADTECAYCLPFFRFDGTSYWTEEEEILFVQTIYKHLRECKIIGQNWQYDASIIFREWGIFFPPFADTMIMQHSAYPGQPKSLAFLASVYCTYNIYWKGERKEAELVKEDLTRWEYNAKDCTKTLEVYHTLKKELKKRGTESVYQHEMSLWTPLFEMAFRGVRVDLHRRNNMIKALGIVAENLQNKINSVVGYPINLNSNLQLKKLFIEQLGLKPVAFKDTECSFKADVMDQYIKQAPRLAPLIQLINDFRSIMIISGHTKATLGPDGRMHTTFHVTGAVTGRFSSTKTPWGDGINFQNVTSGD